MTPDPDLGDSKDAEEEATGTEATGTGATGTGATIEPPAGFRLRRAPRYRSFGITGAVIGVVAGAAVALSFTATSDYSIRTITGYFAAILGLVGTLLGLGLAVLLERRRRS